MTALHWACSMNLTHIVEILFGNKDLNPHILDLKNQIPLEKAILNSNYEIVEMFTRRFTIDYKFRESLLAAIKTSNYPIFK